MISIPANGLILSEIQVTCPASMKLLISLALAISLALPCNAAPADRKPNRLRFSLITALSVMTLACSLFGGWRVATEPNRAAERGKNRSGSPMRSGKVLEEGTDFGFALLQMGNVSFPRWYRALSTQNPALLKGTTLPVETDDEVFLDYIRPSHTSQTFLPETSVQYLDLYRRHRRAQVALVAARYLEFLTKEMEERSVTPLKELPSSRDLFGYTQFLTQRMDAEEMLRAPRNTDDVSYNLAGVYLLGLVDSTPELQPKLAQEFLKTPPSKEWEMRPTARGLGVVFFPLSNGKPTESREALLWQAGPGSELYMGEAEWRAEVCAELWLNSQGDSLRDPARGYAADFLKKIDAYRDYLLQLPE